jgi:hypothetical protein
MCFGDRRTGLTYIEEITGGSLQFISDEGLAQGLEKFLERCGVLDMRKPWVAGNEDIKIQG